MFGLDASGKTCILQRLTKDTFEKTLPYSSTSVHEVNHRRAKLSMWELDRHERGLWRHYYTGVNAIVYVVDAADAERLEKAKAELQTLLGVDDLRDIPLLVYANKQDVGGAATAAAISDALGLSDVRGREVEVQACSAATGEGVWDGIEWLAFAVNPS